jgi:hypothetical protein
MSNPLWREARPSSPYGGQPGARRRGRDAPVPDGDSATARDPGANGPAAPRPGSRLRNPGRGTGETASRYPDGNERLPGDYPTRGGDPWADAPTRRMPERSGETQPSLTQGGVTQPGRGPRDGGARLGNRGSGGAPGPRGGLREPRGYRDDGGSWGPTLGGSLSGGLGVAIVAASTALGASATMLTGREPGTVLGVFVIIGTVAAALAVRPQAGRLILPVPALSYVVAAMVTGVIYDRSADVSKTALAINAAQWIANGFFAMSIATVMAVVLVTARWVIWRRNRPAPAAPGWPAGPPGNRGRPQPGGDDYWAPAGYGDAYGPGGRGEPGPPPTAPRTQGPWRGDQLPDQQWPPRPDPGRPPGSGPYNFSSGA